MLIKALEPLPGQMQKSVGHCTLLPSGSLSSRPWICRLPSAALSPGPVSDAQSSHPTAAEIPATESERQEGDCAPGGLCPGPGPSEASGVWPANPRRPQSPTRTRLSPGS